MRPRVDVSFRAGLIVNIRCPAAGSRVMMRDPASGRLWAPSYSGSTPSTGWSILRMRITIILAPVCSGSVDSSNRATPLPASPHFCYLTTHAKRDVHTFIRCNTVVIRRVAPSQSPFSNRVVEPYPSCVTIFGTHQGYLRGCEIKEEWLL